MRKIFGSFLFIHLLVALGLLALIGELITEAKFLQFFVVLSFAGAVCAAFIRTIDTIKANI